MKYLVDSNIIIYHLNNESLATNFLTKNYQDIAISIISYIEVLSFNFTDEEAIYVKELLSKFKIIDISMDISHKAIENRQKKKIKLPDNLILSTAIVYNLTLVTRNLKDFTSFDVNLYDPFNVQKY